MSRREPPHNLEAENSVLGAVLLSTDALQKVIAAGLRDEHFHRPASLHIFAAAATLHRRGDPVDPVTVAEELRLNGLLDACGGIEELHALQNATPSVTAAAQYAGLIRNAWAARRLIDLAGQLNSLGYSHPDANRLPVLAGELTDQLAALTADATGVAGLELIDWTALGDERSEVLEGLFIEGCWTALNGPGKAGKTTLEVYTGVNLSLGVHPFDHIVIPAVTVLHLDAEAGRLDLNDIVRSCGYDPGELDRWHATDLPPKLNTPEGAALALTTARRLDAGLIIVDGLNGVVDGPENDDTTWRAFFDLFVRPAKAERRAVLTADNTGWAALDRPRGSSVKLDKPDAIVNLRKTDHGAQLRMTHRRSAQFDGIILAATGFDGGTVRYNRTGGGWVAGTTAAADLLDELGLPTDIGRPTARAALTDAHKKATTAGDPDADRYQLRNDVLSSAIRWRKTLR